MDYDDKGVLETLESELEEREIPKLDTDSFRSMRQVQVGQMDAFADYRTDFRASRLFPLTRLLLWRSMER